MKYKIHTTTRAELTEREAERFIARCRFYSDELAKHIGDAFDAGATAQMVARQTIDIVKEHAGTEGIREDITRAYVEGVLLPPAETPIADPVAASQLAVQALGADARHAELTEPTSIVTLPWRGRITDTREAS